MSKNKIEVIDFVKKRNELIKKKRRNFQRVMFDNFLGCYFIIDENDSIYSVDIIDISEAGLQFQVPDNKNNKEKFKKNKDLKLRIYFTTDSYIPVVVHVKRSKKHCDNEGNFFMRYGCEFEQDNQTFEAMRAFIQFISKFAEHSSLDKGDQRAYFL